MQALVPRSASEHEIFKKLPARRRVLILGSSGSIGQSALDVISQFPEQFELAAIVAQGSKPELFAQQIKKYSPRQSLLIDPKAKESVEQLCNQKILCGQEELLELCKSDSVDIVLAAIVGAAGLAPVLSALNAGKIVALANKESLVVGGHLVRNICKKNGPLILPVDSEHSALYQCLLAVDDSEVSSLILTASGGPFLRMKNSELNSITPAQAVKHPRWQMGPKISVDSATLMNKALELIEAHYLYAMPADNMSALIHPQSIVHAIVNLKDGASLMQASNPDMKEPIAFALNYPNARLNNVVPKLDLASIAKLEFEQVDSNRFPAINLALACIAAGSTACIMLNEANEYAVARFLEGSLRFADILPFIQELMSKNIAAQLNNIDDIYGLQSEAARLCDFVMSKFKLS